MTGCVVLQEQQSCGAGWTSAQLACLVGTYTDCRYMDLELNPCCVYATCKGCHAWPAGCPGWFCAGSVPVCHFGSAWFHCLQSLTEWHPPGVLC